MANVEFFPSVQLNTVILSAVAYSPVGHAHALLCLTVAVTQIHDFLSRWLYCRRVIYSPPEEYLLCHC